MTAVRVWRPLRTSTASSARAVFAPRREPRNSGSPCRSRPLTGPRPASTRGSEIIALIDAVGPAGIEPATEGL